MINKIYKLYEILAILDDNGFQRISGIIKPQVDIVAQKKNKPNLINAGLLKAGKSALFNALSGQIAFKTDIIRATTENDIFETGKYIFVDTPGLDANEQDDATAFKGYENADIIIFVHNGIDGELNRMETDSIMRVGKLYGGINELFKSAILVVSNSDQMDVEAKDEISKTIRKQCESLFGVSFLHMCHVNSVGYLKGISENKQLLVETSGIKKLLEVIDNMIKKNKFSLIESRIKNIINTLYKEIEVEFTLNNKKIEDIFAKMVKTNELEMRREEIKGFVEKGYEKMKDVQLHYSTLAIDDVYFYEQESDHHYRFDSKSECLSDFKDVLDKSIYEACKSLTSKVKNCYNEYEYFINPSRAVSAVIKEISEQYNNVKNIFFDITNDSAVPICNFSISSSKAYEYNSYSIKNLSSFYCEESDFKSIRNDFLNKFEDTFIKIKYERQSVQTLFGWRDKDIAYYNWRCTKWWEIKKDAKDMANNYIREAEKDTIKIYGEYMSILREQFKTQIQVIIEKLNEFIEKVERENALIEEQLKDLKHSIDLLNNIKAELAEV